MVPGVHRPLGRAVLLDNWTPQMWTELGPWRRLILPAIPTASREGVQVAFHLLYHPRTTLFGASGKSQQLGWGRGLGNLTKRERL